MKKYAITMWIMTVLAVAGFVYARSSGYGRTLTATTTTTLIALSANNTVSIYNPTTNIVHALVNCTTNEFNTLYAATNTIPVPAGQKYTFDTQAKQNIDSICYRVPAGTAVFYLAVF